MAHENGSNENGAAHWAPRLARVLDRLHEQFAALDALSAHQGPLVESDDPEPLLALLAERRSIIDQIERTNRDLEPLRPEWERGAGSLAAFLRDQIRVRIDRIGDLADAIARRDEADQARLACRRDATADRLIEIGRARGAVAAYGTARAGGAAFQDTEA
jgi:hypothetical protein